MEQLVAVGAVRCVGNGARIGVDLAVVRMRSSGQSLCCRCFRRPALSRSALSRSALSRYALSRYALLLPSQQPPPHAHHLDGLFYALNISLTSLNPLPGSAMNDDDDDFSDGQGIAPGPDGLLRPVQSATRRHVVSRATFVPGVQSATPRPAQRVQARQRDESGKYGVRSICRGHRRKGSRLNSSCAFR